MMLRIYRCIFPCRSPKLGTKEVQYGWVDKYLTNLRPMFDYQGRAPTRKALYIRACRCNRKALRALLLSPVLYAHGLS